MTTDEKLDLLLSQISTMKSDMHTMKAEMSDMKSDINGIQSNMVTKDYLDNRLHNLENSLLEEIDLIQEKSNNHYHDLTEKMNQIRVDVRTRGSEDILARLAKAEIEIEDIKKKVS